MTELLTTDETAKYLRMSERKLYELVAAGALPCTKITGRWLFPRDALDRWVLAGLIKPASPALGPAPPTVGGSTDPLLEWSVRASGSGLATLPEGSDEGLHRLANGEVIAAAVHFHTVEGDDADANTEAVAGMPGIYDAVVIAFAQREKGILVAPGNPVGLTDLASIATKRARMAQRPRNAGAQLLLVSLLARAGIVSEKLNAVTPVCQTGLDLAQAIRAGHADCGIATRSVALAAALDFIPLAWEHFDLVFRQRDYFLAGPQALMKFMRGAAFRSRADEIGGYDVKTAGEVRFVK